MFRKLVTVLALTAMLGACATGYSLIAAATPVAVADGGMTVTPGVAWNKAPRSSDQPRYEEVWTADGVLLNTITFYGGVPEGKALIRQRKSAERQAPLFKANMLPQEVAEFVESTYRVLSGSTVFNMESLKPAIFAGEQGFQLDFNYVLQSDELKRKGRAIGAIKNGKLYMMMYDGTATHYFDAMAGEFDRVVKTARISGATS